MEETSARRGCLFALENDSDLLLPRAAEGVAESALRRTRLFLGEGLAGAALREGRFSWVPDLSLSPQYRRFTLAPVRPEAALFCPVAIRREPLGVVCLHFPIGSACPDLARLGPLCRLIGFAWLSARLYEEAEKDGLTGLFQGRALRRRLENALRESPPVEIALFDLDRFKEVNDTYGHAAGDQVLRLFARILGQAVEARRPRIIWAGRLGGEEFAAVFPAASAGCAVEFAEEIRRRLETSEVLSGRRRFRVTASAGVSRSDAPVPPENLLARADAALYRAKSGGRNRVVSDLL